MENNKKLGLGMGIFLVILIILLQVICMIPTYSVAIMMGDMMASIGTTYTVLGLAVTLVTAMGGAFMFIAPTIQNKLGLWNMITISAILVIAGCILVAIAPNGAVLLTGRVLHGFGYGAVVVSVNPIIGYYFTDKARSAVLTVNTVASSLAITVSYMLPNYITPAAGTWKANFYVFAAVAAITCVLWLVAGLMPKAGDLGKNTVEKGEKVAFRDSALVRAMKYKQFWILTIAGVFANHVSVVNGTYLPTALNMELGIDMVAASAVSSVTSLGGIFGSMAGGFLVAVTCKSKPWMWISRLAGFFCIIAITLTSNIGLLTAVSAIFGFVIYLAFTPQSTMTIETQDDFTILGAAFALVNGFALLCNLLVPSIFTALTNATGSMISAMRIDAFLLLAAAIIAIVGLKETGKKKTEKAD